MKKIYSSILGALMLATLLTAGIGFSPVSKTAQAENAVASSETEKLICYETAEEKAEFDIQGRTGTVTEVQIKDSSLELTEANFQVSENTLILQDLPEGNGLILGGDYVCSVQTDAGDYELPFKYVTKAISTPDDCKIFDVTTKKLIEGYYVLLNDIDLSARMINYHFEIQQDYLHSRLSTNNGFRGIFDGMGHTITYYAGKCGFFGMLTGNATIMNTGFVVSYPPSQLLDGGDYNPAIAGFVYGDALIKDCYFQSEKSIGGIVYYVIRGGGKFTTENIVIDYKAQDAKVYDPPNGSGLFIGRDGTWCETGRDGRISNVYILSPYRMGANKDPSDDPDKMGNENQNLYELKYSSWLETYAGNEGVEENLVRGVKVYKNIKKYATYSAMKADKNNYTAFNTNYWDISQGVPLWKNYEYGSLDDEAVTDSPPASSSESGSGCFASLTAGSGVLCVGGTLLSVALWKAIRKKDKENEANG